MKVEQVEQKKSCPTGRRFLPPSHPSSFPLSFSLSLFLSLSNCFSFSLTQTYEVIISWPSHLQYTNISFLSLFLLSLFLLFLFLLFLFLPSLFPSYKKLNVKLAVKKYFGHREQLFMKTKSLAFTSINNFSAFPPPFFLSFFLSPFSFSLPFFSHMREVKVKE